MHGWMDGWMEEARGTVCSWSMAGKIMSCLSCVSVSVRVYLLYITPGSVDMITKEVRTTYCTILCLGDHSFTYLFIHLSSFLATAAIYPAQLQKLS
jgi:hypothetical protein